MKSGTESQLSKILRTLGNKDSIKIIRFAKTGFDSTSDAHKRMGLSLKRYYYRLEKLMDAGLVLKENERYQLTPLGDIVQRTIEEKIVWAIENINQLRLIKILKSEVINDEALRELVPTLFSNIPHRLDEADVKVIQTYETLVDTVSRLFERSTRKIYMATRYTDSRVVEAAWRTLRRGVEIWGLDGDVELRDGRLRMLRMVLSHPKSIKAFYDLWHSDICHVRYGKVPFSFIVIDGTACIVEIINPLMTEFFVAIQFENNEIICRTLEETFHKLWDEGTEDPLKELSEDLMSGIRRE